MAPAPRDPRVAFIATALASALLLTGCAGDSATGDDPECDTPLTIDLAPGEHRIADPAASGGCFLIPSSAADTSEYLVVGYSASGDETPNGVSGSYELTVAPGGTVAVRSDAPYLRTTVEHSFHDRLRQRERRAADAAGAFAAMLRQPARRVPPTVGSERTFKVCATVSCETVATVPATARYVGAHGAIYLDNSVPAGGYTQAELDSLGIIFDTQLFPIDTVAFGRESDVDGNGVVAILLSDQVNALSPTCASNGQLVPGYFNGEDLLPGTNSNLGEVFFAVVPDPSNALCFGKSVVQRVTGPTLAHEFQHMISYNRHVLLSGGAPEDTWLNEGLSLLAEELGGRQVNAAFCAGGNCLNQYAAANLRNAARYLQSPVSTYLVEPGTSAGTLAERGANWLFTRWLVDLDPDSLLGTGTTRLLLGADQANGLTLTGSANVTAAAFPLTALAGNTFVDLLGAWHLANFAETRAGLADPTGRMRYRSWNLRASIDAVQPGPFPLVPALATSAGLARSGILRGGSGDYIRAILEPGDGPLVVRFSAANAATVQPKLAVVRLR